MEYKYVVGKNWAKIFFLATVICLLCSCSKAAPDIPSGYTEGYEPADFNKLNSPASENGLGGTLVYLQGKYDTVNEIKAGGGTTFYAITKDKDNHQWLVMLDSQLLSQKETYEKMAKKELIIKGVYNGFSGTYKLPIITIDQIYDIETGNITVSALSDSIKKKSGESNNTQTAVLEKPLVSSTTEALQMTEPSTTQAIEILPQPTEVSITHSAYTTSSDYHANIEATTEATTEAAPSLSIDIIDSFSTSFNWMGNPYVSGYIKIKNTCNKNVMFDRANYGIDFEDDTGKLLMTDELAICVPKALKPGQTGYVYSYYCPADGINIDNGLVPKLYYKLVEADDFYEVEVTDTAFSINRSAGLQINVSGRGTNKSEWDLDNTNPSAIFFDKNDNVVGFCYGLVSFSKDQTRSFSISGDLISHELDPSSVSRVEVYIQGNNWHF